VYTQATSVEGETNGLIDPHTGALLVPAGLLASPPPGADGALSDALPRADGSGADGADGRAA
jgi:hypothetical protein